MGQDLQFGRNKKEKKWIEVGTMTCRKVTDDGVLLDGNWYPRSQLKDGYDIEEGDLVDVEVTEWYAKETGVIDW